MIKAILSITLGGLIFATVHYGVPAYHDWRESIKQEKLDIKDCWPRKPHRMPITKVLMCEKLTLVKPGK